MPHPSAVGLAARRAEPGSGPRNDAVMVAVLLVATFMGQFDFFVVNVAAPSLRSDLGISDVTLELVVGGYAFAYAAGLITGGRLGDIFGHRRMYVLGINAFAAASLLCGIATDGPQLVVARMVQGLTAAMMLPQVLGLITAVLPADRRRRATAWYGVASGLGGIAGQVLGGVLVSTDIAGLGWRAIFLVNVPIGVVGGLLARRYLPEPPVAARSRLDLPGAVGFAVSLALVLVPLTLGRSVHWAPWTWALIVLALAGGIATLWWERRLGRRGGSPLLELTLLAVRSFRAGLAANFAFLLYFASYMFTLTLFSQTGLGLSPLQAGLVFTPTAALFMVSALVGHRLVTRWGTRPIIGGALLTSVSLTAVAVLVAAKGDHTSALVLTLVAAGMGPGNGLVLPSLIGAALVDVPQPHAGAAAGALATVQQFAASSGVAVLGTVYFAAAGSRSGPAHGMVWASSIEVALVVGVAVLVYVGTRRTARHGLRS
jgi:MFS family permease